MFLSAALLFPMLISFYYREGQALSFFLPAFLSFIVGGILYTFFHRPGESIGNREAFGIVSFGWLGAAVFGALPFLLSGMTYQPGDAFFESMSGFTTTGATVFTQLEAMPKSILFWRAMTQWIGGMGIIVLAIAVLPLLGIGGMQLYHAETPGPQKDRLSPRVQDTAKILWAVYVGMTLVCTFLLMLGGMSFFEAICHAFTTLSTGGFGTRDASMAAFQSPYIEWVIVIFMFLSGVNFSMHFKALKGDARVYLRSEEFVFYAMCTVVATLLITYLNFADAQSFSQVFRDAAFQVVSIATTTGFTTTDYEKWFPGAQMILLILMTMGACAGSTSGGIKIIRILTVFKYGLHQVFRLIHPKAVRSVKIDHKVVPVDVLESVLGLIVLFVGTSLFASVIMADLGMEFMSAGTAVLACIGNVGPGFGSVGPTHNFSDIPQLGKFVLALCMLIGRLEIFTVIVLFFPSFWRKY